MTALPDYVVVALERSSVTHPAVLSLDEVATLTLARMPPAAAVSLLVNHEMAVLYRLPRGFTVDVTRCFSRRLQGLSGTPALLWHGVWLREVAARRRLFADVEPLQSCDRGTWLEWGYRIHAGGLTAAAAVRYASLVDRTIEAAVDGILDGPVVRVEAMQAGDSRPGRSTNRAG